MDTSYLAFARDLSEGSSSSGFSPQDSSDVTSDDEMPPYGWGGDE